jgi:hypothetical protein
MGLWPLPTWHRPALVEFLRQRGDLVHEHPAVLIGDALDGFVLRLVHEVDLLMFLFLGFGGGRRLP